VAGAAGRVGRRVVENLVKRGTGVLAAVRNVDSGKETLESLFGGSLPPEVQIVPCDLTSANSMQEACKDADAVIFCASGLSPSTGTVGSAVRAVKSFFGVKEKVDSAAAGVLARALLSGAKKGEVAGSSTPRLVHLSSAAVTRPSWSEEEKEVFKEVAEIPIVKLNPFDILGDKLEGEESVRSSGVPYCVVRACGLNDNQPPGRPVVVTGDVSVGRICRSDVAEVLVSCLFEQAASQKTFEVFSRPELPKNSGIFRSALERVKPDSKDWRDAVGSRAVSPELYSLLQQLQGPPPPRPDAEVEVQSSSPSETARVEGGQGEETETVEEKEKIVQTA